MAADLHKKSEVSPFELFERKLEAWVNAHAPILFILSILILFLLIIGLIFAIATVYGASTGTEANIYYNQLESII